MKRVRAKRVYDPVGKTDGMRVLVDRVWPRGMAKEALQADLWLKRIAPSTALRNWFAHDPGKWPEFKRRYFLELDANPDAVAELRSAAGKRPVTLLYSARDETHNNAVALAEYLATR